ncbi:MAG: glycosidase [Blastocatellia bacterium AA13]|nr:MAG: glycosidase [Blastocatellia bacterium AA13]
MANTTFRELFRRYKQNPILTASSWPYPANSVFNAAATALPTGETLLLVRVEDRRGISHLTAARSDDGITSWRIDPQPTLSSDPERFPEEIWGIEDPRITWIAELDRYAITYTSYSTSGPLVSLVLTRDFKTFERKGVITPPEDKDAALLPHRIGGRWVLIHRPVSGFPGSRANMWLSYSPDLKHWGDHCVMLEARRGAWWDANKIGLSPPAIETSEGWLVIYHGVRMTAAGCLYRLGLALFDLEDPARLVKRGDEWVFGPDESYERVGDVGDVVFPCGLVHDPATGNLRLYYGAADTSIALATGNVGELLDWLRGRPS